MTTHNVAYRLTIYQASLSQAASTVLTPSASSAHAQEFKVTTLPSLAGWQPYLHAVSGTSGRLDPLTRRWETGQLTVEVIDARVGGSNTARWVTAFTGESTTSGVNPLLNCKAYVEESLDGGSTWAAFFVGRIQAVDLAAPNVMQFTLRDFAEELKQPIFVARPHSSVSYAVLPCVLPRGLSATYGGVPAVRALTATVSTPSGLPSGWRKLTLDGASSTALRNAATGELKEYFLARGRLMSGGIWNTWSLKDGLRVQFASGVTGKDARVRAVEFWWPSGRDANSPGSSTPMAPGGGLAQVTAVYIENVDATDPYYTNISSLSGNYDFRVYRFAMPEDPAANTVTASDPIPAPAGQRQTTPTSPLLLGNVAPMTLVTDILDGKFSALNTDGTTRVAFAYDSASLSALSSPSGSRRGLPTLNLPITRQESIADFLESAICRPLGLAYRLEPFHNSGNPVSRLVMCDLRLTTTTDYGTLPLIVDDDLVATEPIGWVHKTDDAATIVRVTGYVDDVADPDDAASEGEVRPPVESIPFTTTGAVGEETGRETLGVKFFDVEARSLHYPVGEYAGLRALTAEAYLTATAREIRRHYLPMVGWGVMETVLVCRRTATTTGIRPGMWVRVGVSMLPDPATRVRGGTRLMLVTSREDKGPTLTFELTDAGPFTTAGAPTVGALAAGTLAKHYVNVPITLNADSDPVVIEAAIRYNTTSAPAASSDLWHPVLTVTTSATHTIGPLPSNANIFVRARSAPKARLRLPSAWVTPNSGNAYLATAQYTAPSSLTITPGGNITGTSTFTVSWTNGESTLPVAVKVEQPYSVTTYYGIPSDFSFVLPPGSTSFTLNPYVQVVPGPGATTTIGIHVYHLDPWGGVRGVGGGGTVDEFYVGPTLSAPTLAIVGTPGYFADPLHRRNRTTGYRISITGMIPGTDTVLEMDTGSGFSAPVTVGKYPGAKAPRGELVVDIPVPYDNTTRYFRARNVATGYANSTWSASVSGVPRVLV